MIIYLVRVKIGDRQDKHVLGGFGVFWDNDDSSINVI
ncbi:hypothetical protein BVRB_6g135820 [Beta vulgaris subsp. vulgaris]|nr:hypothetical protein BVRB_6g135820 [Beta vulgaris subsp. vulgaris]